MCSPNAIPFRWIPVQLMCRSPSTGVACNTMESPFCKDLHATPYKPLSTGSHVQTLHKSNQQEVVCNCCAIPLYQGIKGTHPLYFKLSHSHPIHCRVDSRQEVSVQIRTFQAISYKNSFELHLTIPIQSHVVMVSNMTFQWRSEQFMQYQAHLYFLPHPL